MASAVTGRADHGNGERQIWILPRLTCTLVRWVVIRTPLSPSFGRNTEFHLSEGNDFEVVVVVEKGDWYKEVVKLLYRLLQGLQAVKQLNIKELMEFL